MARSQNTRDDHVTQIEDLVSSARALDRGPTKIAILEEAVRIADSHHDTDRGFALRLELIDVANFGGRQDVGVVAFAWCLAAVDREPERFDGKRILWMYKWMITASAKYPQFPRSRLGAMLADMGRRYAEAGAGMHPVHQTARELYRILGDLPAATAAHERAMRCSEDPLSNCRACEQDSLVAIYLDTDRTDLALRAAEPIVGGRMTCAVVPHCTYPFLLLPLVLRGQAELAAVYHRKGLKLIGTKPQFVSEAAHHIFFLAFTGNLVAAAKLFSKNLLNAASATCPVDQFDFARTGMFLFDVLADAEESATATDRKKVPRVRFPTSYLLPDGVSSTDPAALRDHFGDKARELARAFDARNGNDWYTRRLDELADLKARITPHTI
ncbi:MAG TPA: hypothetical protein VGE74_26295 [Gemmata sp.]